MNSYEQQPPYLEVYKHAPLMYLSICNFDFACAQVPPKTWMVWVHSVQAAIDDIATAHGLYKMKALMQGSSCLFSISPDMPPKEQAALMLNAAKELLDALSKVGF